jgi:LacI family transcriptional regulator
MASLKRNTVTILDVAREAGTSYGTVSRLLNHNENVAKATRERVLLAIEKLGYIPNQQARSLVRADYRFVGSGFR